MSFTTLDQSPTNPFNPIPSGTVKVKPPTTRKGENKMDQSRFANITTKQIEMCKSVLITKNEEYGVGSILHNFEVAAELRGCSNKEALAGFMAKHTVSIYDMCASDKEFTIEQWDEKITDHINYLLILKVIVEEGELK